MSKIKLSLHLIWVLLFINTLSCGGDPEKLSSKSKRRSHRRKKKKLPETRPRIALFGNLGNFSRTLLIPQNIERFYQKRNKVGVIYLRGETAFRSLKMLEFATVSKKKRCKIDWYLHVWSKDRHVLGEVMWECKIIRIGKVLYDLKGTPRKVMATLITKSRLFPNFWLSILKVPVLHDPKVVSESISGFVQEIIPKDYTLERYPSFTVATQHTRPLPSDFSLIDKRVESLRNRLKNRLSGFSTHVIKKSKGRIYKILPPFSIKEKFARELFAEWGTTVLCKLGTNSDMMFWLGNWPRLGVVKMKIPTHYSMVVLKKNRHVGPSLFANISSLELDPPIEFSTY
jgi:hypothetical protein